jgi:hypothetical protein
MADVNVASHKKKKKNKQSSVTSDLAIVELPWKLLSSKLAPPAITRKKYAT